ncbi:hypothetical protein CEP53_004655 [Fusarium sp. AF-6]|nr:hypothetical protein CEP53_004655 [Fusarium sp. AF-6]
MCSSRAHGSPLSRGPGSGTQPLKAEAQGWTRPKVNNLFLLNQDGNSSPLPIDLLTTRILPRSCVLSCRVEFPADRGNPAAPEQPQARDAAAATNEE